MGVVLLLLQVWFAELYNLPIYIIQFFTAANILYGLYALSLACSNVRSLNAIKLLVYANYLWAGVSVLLVINYNETISFWGVAVILVESLFVIMLASVEWKNRDALNKWVAL